MSLAVVEVVGVVTIGVEASVARVNHRHFLQRATNSVTSPSCALRLPIFNHRHPCHS